MSSRHVFDRWNPDGPPCPVCHTRADRPTVLVPIPWTERDGICEARQVHHACIELITEMRDAEEAEHE